jgi:hypothetical protein
MAVESSSPLLAPNYVKHREFKAVAPVLVDPLPHTVRAHGMNMSSRRYALVQVIPGTGAPDPAVKVMFWSESAGKFVDQNPALTKAGAGVGVPYEFVVECYGRVMLVVFTGGLVDGDDAAVFVSSFSIDQR